MDYVILAFFAPEPGKVLKTFSPGLDPQKCAQLYSAYIEDALEFTQELGVRRVVACNPGVKHPFFQNLTKKVYIEMADWAGSTQGQLIQNALQIGYQKGGNRVVYWDGQAPQISDKSFKEVFTRLDKADYALGPSMDYSTYIIGARKNSPNIFDGVPWDSPKEFSSLVHSAEAAKKEVYILPILQRLRRMDDLPFFAMNARQIIKSNGRVFRHTRKVLEGWNLL